MWVKFFSANGGNQSWQVWVGLRGKTKIPESKMAKFKMATIMKLSRNEWVKFFVKNGWNQEGRIQDGCHHQVKSEWMSEVFCAKWLKPRRENSRWLPSSSWVRMNKFETEWISLSQSQSGRRVFLSESERRKQGVWIPQYRSWIQVGRIQDGCHHQVKSELMSEVFCAKWLKPSRENSRWLPSSSWVRMNKFESDWISLSQSQSGRRVFLSESERR